MNTDKRRLSKPKKFFIVVGILLVAFLGYVQIVNINSKNMTYRQKLLKAVYPVVMWFSKAVGKNSKPLENTGAVAPLQSFYDLTIPLGNGNSLPCATLKGKKIILVNTASDCGYTRQYGELQSLYEANKSKLVVIGFPSNDFKEQEKGTDASIGDFCKINYGVTFPLAAKSVVAKAVGQNTVFEWLTNKSKNGWNGQAPSWNFCKYLVNEEGVLTHYFPTAINPGGDEVKTALQK